MIVIESTDTWMRWCGKFIID